MMRISSCLARLAAVLLPALAAASVATAQTAPAWGSATRVGTRSSTHDEFGRTAVDGAGNLYRVGSFSGSLDLGGTVLTARSADTDAYLAKYTSSGTLAWVRHLSSAAQDIAHDVALDAAGNVYLTGSYTDDLDLGNDVALTGGGQIGKLFVARFSPQGLAQWARQSAPAPDNLVGGSGLVVDAGGTVAVTGLCHGSISIGTTTATLPAPAKGGAFLARFNGATGALLTLAPGFWYSRTGQEGLYLPHLALAPAGDYYLLTQQAGDQTLEVGSTTLLPGGTGDAVATRISAAGTVIWAQHLAIGNNPQANFYYRGRTDAAGNLYLAGTFSGTAHASGTTIVSSGDYDAFLLKYSPQGAVEWLRTSGGTGLDRWSDLSLDAQGNAYVTGSFASTATIGSTSLTSAGGSDVAVACYSPQGQVRWAQRAGGPGNDHAYFLGLEERAVRVLGSFTDGSAFGSVVLNSSLASGELFVGVLQNPVLAARAAQPQALAGLYPNPATEVVRLPTMPGGTHIQFIDRLGRVARETTVSAAAQVSVRGLAPGLYTLRATDVEGRQFAGRVAVE
ncbi:T9SS type A sorting domain-containing protein [Hymenobacter cellulosivorans]|uniref:T9SS type A sorting domain-containing protein n=1 Tax=Hymenobacter cellulosivorans TaxID=2932249 RepID=A0ABY4F886_9BACT|nr:T9SS type A sorting domain-containing protein [Hymenobacter cellulosivorans]UOQ52232.1 T9SS type A sorting domain-containing protein [Hymenobacter cellulosivorans]